MADNNKKITSNSFIDIDMVSSAENMLIIGNMSGFFGEFSRTKDNKHPVTVDIKNTNPAVISRLSLIANVLKSGKTVTVVTNKETQEYYSMLFTFIQKEMGGFRKQNIQFKTINKNEEYISFLNVLVEKGMKFDYIIQNPPYSGSLHLDFLNKGLDLLDESGKMVIIEPATWLINVRRTGKAKLYDSIKSRLGNHVYKVVIENLNKEFDTAMYVPFSITYIDLNQEFGSIDFWCCGEHRVVDNLYDCNMIGDYDMIWSILGKIKQYGQKVGTMKDHIYKDGKSIVNDQTYYCKYSEIVPIILCQTAQTSHVRGGGYMFDSAYQYNEDGTSLRNGDFFKAYYSNFYHYNSNKISETPLHTYNSANKETDKVADCLYGTKQELENWKHFVFNNKIPLFTSIVLVIDQHNTCKDVLCWLTAKQYTDSEIYQLLGITEDEQKFIDKTIKKYERHSPWFKRYMCGKDSVSNEEVQKFIDSL